MHPKVKTTEPIDLWPKVPPHLHLPLHSRWVCHSCFPGICFCAVSFQDSPHANNRSSRACRERVPRRVGSGASNSCPGFFNDTNAVRDRLCDVGHVFGEPREDGSSFVVCPMVYTLERSTFIPRSRAEVFSFFSDAHNLESITPDFLRFRILTPDPIVMQVGTQIEYQMRLYGLLIRWKTLIQRFEPDEYFVDVQLSGPYRSWRHRHLFEELATGTQMHDRVDYEMPFGLVGSFVRALFVRSVLEKIFDYRNAAIANRFHQGGER